MFIFNLFKEKPLYFSLSEYQVLSWALLQVLRKEKHRLLVDERGPFKANHTSSSSQFCPAFAAIIHAA
jgi:hypothetical protein